ncbi:ribonuclease HI [Sulfurimonas sp.]|uniref:ribonuclease HI n=1 Tax=Sulfurimonas sp. TaxID=2022749 RepID=UPI002AAF6AD8|nr:RNase H family protein [Sulfurimonas sp.]
MKKNKSQIYLFTDGSVNPQSAIGCGAYLLLDKLEFSFAQLEKEIKIKKFDNTSSTKLELETLLWALNDVSLKKFKIVIYTDCQNIIGLKDRRERFERNNYMTSKGVLIKNHKLYKDFFKNLDILDCEFIKVKGHKKASAKNEIDEIFTLVDRATRKALRKTIL